MSDPVLISLIATIGSLITSTIAATLSFLNNKKVNLIDTNMANLEKNTNNKMDLLLEAKDELRHSTNKSADAEGFKRGSETKG